MGWMEGWAMSSRQNTFGPLVRFGLFLVGRPASLEDTKGVSFLINIVFNFTPFIWLD